MLETMLKNVAPRSLLVAALVAVVLSGCGSNPEAAGPPTNSPSAPTISATPTATPEPSATAAPGTTITTGDSEFGPMLFGANNQAIYIWEVETTATPACYDDCAAAWPPVLTVGGPVAAGAVEQPLLGTMVRTDGSTQVTYGGHPLYYYAHEGPGEVKCHNVSTHGGLWWVVQPNGERAP